VLRILYKLAESRSRFEIGDSPRKLVWALRCIQSSKKATEWDIESWGLDSKLRTCKWAVNVGEIPRTSLW